MYGRCEHCRGHRYDLEVNAPDSELEALSVGGAEEMVAVLTEEGLLNDIITFDEEDGNTDGD